MKYLIKIVLSLLLIIGIFPGKKLAAETVIPTKEINVVYDDSGSMIEDNNNVYVDTWCQAKYAMEVFAALLGEKDTMNIYYMSDFTRKANSAPKITLKGGSSPDLVESNVKKIHDTVTEALDTPYNTVKKAYSDLVASSAEEKWLVILTDGVFSDCKNSQVSENIKQYTKDGSIRVIMLGIGPDAAEIEGDPDNGIFYYKAESSSDILHKLTLINNRIFQYNSLEYNSEKKSISFGIPMKEIIVFAQGENVQIKCLKDSTGKIIEPDSNILVQYSENACTNTKRYPVSKTIIAKNLKGSVACFSNLPIGDYTIEVTGEETVDIYYKPNISIAMHLYEGTKDVTEEEQLIAGTYRIEFDFVDPSTGQKVKDTSLLGEIKYTGKLVNTNYEGEVRETVVTNGDQITITDGSLELEVLAEFLSYNTVQCNEKFEIFSNNQLVFTAESKPTYVLSKTGFKSDNPIVIKVQIRENDELKDLTSSQWQLLNDLEVVTTNKIGGIRLEKGTDIGTIYLYPSCSEDPMENDIGSIGYRITGSFTQGASSASGTFVDTFTINDTISSTDRLLDWAEKHTKELIISLVGFVILFGYMPGVKKRLLGISPNNRISLKPIIHLESKDREAEKVDRKEYKATVDLNLLSHVLPYVSERATVNCLPKSFRHGSVISKFELKAIRNNRIKITNSKKLSYKKEMMYRFGNYEPTDFKKDKPIIIDKYTPIFIHSNDGRKGYWFKCILDEKSK